MPPARKLGRLATWIFYQREVDRASTRSSAKMDELDRALAEIDHRMINDFQAVQALIETGHEAGKFQAARPLRSSSSDAIAPASMVAS